LKNRLYYLATASLFESNYKGSDGIQRSTAYDSDFVLNLLLGREFEISQRHRLFLDVKTTWAGGKRYTPIDLERSIAAGELKRDNTRRFEGQYPDYFKLDFKFEYRQSSGRVTQEWMFYVENITNQQNILAEKYDTVSQSVKKIYQLGIFPMMQYRIYF